MGLVYANIELVNAGEIFLAQKGYIKPSEVKRIYNLKIVRFSRVLVDTLSLYPPYK